MFKKAVSFVGHAVLVVFLLMVLAFGLFSMAILGQSILESGKMAHQYNLEHQK